MLTSFTWVPKGAMKAQPLLSTDSVDAARQKLHQLYPGAEEGEGSAATHPDVKGKTRKAIPKKSSQRIGSPEEEEDAMNLLDATNDTLRDVAGGGAGAILDQVESESEDELADRVFKETDLVFAVAAADEGEGSAGAGAAASRLELYTYDEPEDTLFIHHDMELAAFPLCSAWLTDGVTSLMAVGTMLPFVEIWALDVMDSVAPMMLLGGCEKMEDNYHPKHCLRRLKPDSHNDAVLTVAWNHVAQNIFVSGSADHTIKLWDLNQSSAAYQEGSGPVTAGSSGGVCLGTYREGEKVQSVCFHRQDPNLLLSGGFDSVMKLRDCRQPEQNSFRMAMNSEVIEHVEFVPEVSRMPSEIVSPGGSGGPVMQVMASTSLGSWAAFDLRNAAKPLWLLQPHPPLSTAGGGARHRNNETTFSCSLHVPGLFATGGKDGRIILWDGRHGGEPQQIVSRDYRTGSVLSIAFHPNSPHILGACGTKGEPLVYTMTDDLKSRW